VWKRHIVSYFNKVLAHRAVARLVRPSDRPSTQRLGYKTVPFNAAYGSTSHETQMRCVDSNGGAEKSHWAQHGRPYLVWQQRCNSSPDLLQADHHTALKEAV